ncbi:SLOG family protein [Streptomyces hygroscopicus]|uniref:SLOG family protein n=1 Tax=Streptomyces hygroscopicus TaxID=1912 RepID=UPI000826C2DF|nr:SLOG family protein [Streptomyces hygroscopicus]
MTNSHSRVLICGSRRWPWPDTITTLLDRAADRHGNDLVIIEGASTGAASAAHHWCTRHDLPAWRHRCHPLTPAPGRRTRCWSEAERNQRILHDEGPRLVIAFHENLHPNHPGSTNDMCRRALTLRIPVWLVPTADPDKGLWLHLSHYTGPPSPAPRPDQPELTAAPSAAPGTNPARTHVQSHPAQPPPPS